MWPDVFLCGLTGVWSEHGGLCLEGSQEGLAPELGFEVQLEFHQAADEGKVFVSRDQRLKARRHYMSSSLAFLPLFIVTPLWADAVPLPGPGQLENRLCRGEVNATSSQTERRNLWAGDAVPTLVSGGCFGSNPL